MKKALIIALLFLTTPSLAHSSCKLPTMTEVNRIVAELIDLKDTLAAISLGALARVPEALKALDKLEVRSAEIEAELAAMTKCMKESETI